MRPPSVGKHSMAELLLLDRSLPSFPRCLMLGRNFSDAEPRDDKRVLDASCGWYSMGTLQLPRSGPGRTNSEGPVLSHEATLAQAAHVAAV